MDLKRVIVTCFLDWVEGPLTTLRLGNPDYYLAARDRKLARASLNPWLTTEADIQVKFGGFLDRRLTALDADLTVHAELPVYPNTRQSTADLSVHNIGTGALWLTDEPLTTTLRAVIEIKYANYRDPDILFTTGEIGNDLDKLSQLPPGVLRFLVIIDEGLRIASDRAATTVHTAREYGVTVLSNKAALSMN